MTDEDEFVHLPDGEYLLAPQLGAPVALRLDATLVAAYDELAEGYDDMEGYLFLCPNHVTANNVRRMIAEDGDHEVDVSPTGVEEALRVELADEETIVVLHATESFVSARSRVFVGGSTGFIPAGHFSLTPWDPEEHRIRSYRTIDS